MPVMMRPSRRQAISRSTDAAPVVIDGKEYHRTWLLLHDEECKKISDTQPMAYACYIEGVDAPEVIRVVEKHMMLLCAKINEVFPEEG